MGASCSEVTVRFARSLVTVRDDDIADLTAVLHHPRDGAAAELGIIRMRGDEHHALIRHAQ